MLCSLDKLLWVRLSRTSLYMNHLLLECSASGLSTLQACLRWAHEAVGEVVVLSTAVNMNANDRITLFVDSPCRIRSTAAGMKFEGCACQPPHMHARQCCAPGHGPP